MTVHNQRLRAQAMKILQERTPRSERTDDLKGVTLRTRPKVDHDDRPRTILSAKALDVSKVAPRTEQEYLVDGYSYVDLPHQKPKAALAPKGKKFILVNTLNDNVRLADKNTKETISTVRSLRTKPVPHWGWTGDERTWTNGDKS